MNQHTKFGMKEHLFVLIIAFTCVCLSLGIVGKARQVKSDSDDLMRLKAREDQYTQGILKKDITLLSAVFADSFIDTFSTGQVVDKEQYIAAIKADTSVVASVNVEGQKYTLYGDAAVVTAKFTVKGKDQGKSFEVTGRSTDVWIKMNGEWFCVAAHSCLLK